MSLHCTVNHQTGGYMPDTLKLLWFQVCVMLAVHILDLTPWSCTCTAAFHTSSFATNLLLHKDVSLAMQSSSPQHWWRLPAMHRQQLSLAEVLFAWGPVMTILILTSPETEPWGTPSILHTAASLSAEAGLHPTHGFCPNPYLLQMRQ